jgi:putative flippase GtrA
MPWFSNLSMQFVKFSMIGVMNCVITYGIYCLLLFLNFHYMAALIIAFIFGLLSSYFWNKYWVFASGHHFKRDLPRFITVYMSMLAINAALLPIFVEYLKIDPRIAQLFFLMFLPLLSFLGLKYWSFK